METKVWVYADWITLDVISDGEGFAEPQLVGELTAARVSCDLRIDLGWLHFTSIFPSYNKSCDLRIDLGWLHLS